MRPSLLPSLLLALVPCTAFTQGSLTPPGAPAATMRSLTQVEPRTPIAGGTSTVTISQAGAYYLTGNLTVATGHGIQITADNVSLDLNGFTISSTSASPNGFGVHLSGGRAHIAVTNGHIRGTTTQSGGIFSGGGFVSGVDYTLPVPRSVRVSALSVSGMGSYGIDLGPDTSSVISGCTVRTVGELGLRAGSISDSSALEAGGTNAILATTLSNSIGTLTGAGTAVVVAQPTIASVSAQLTSVQTGVGQVDPRTRLVPNAGTILISQAGSYVLTGNHDPGDTNDGIRITADNVTVDLNGFTITSVAPAAGGSGVAMVGMRRNITIMNGHIVGGSPQTSGFIHGIRCDADSRNIRIERVNVSNVPNGITSAGTALFMQVSQCTVSAITGRGIMASLVHDCMATDCGDEAILGDVVAGCHGASKNEAGISGNTVSNCSATTESTLALRYALKGLNVTHCRGEALGASTAGGIQGTVVTNSYGVSISDRGIQSPEIISHSYGESQTGAGMVGSTLNTCVGRANAGFNALVAPIGIGCRTAGGNLVLTNRYLMP